MVLVIALALLVSGFSLPATTLDDFGSSGRDRLLIQEVTRGIEWEKLWAGGTSAYRMPASGDVTLAIYIDENYIEFCSNEMQFCERYMHSGSELWQEVDFAPCRDRESSRECLLNFLIHWEHTPLHARAVVFSRMQIVHAHLRSNSEIIEQQKKRRPTLMTSLDRWVLGFQGCRSVVIPCFLDSDPVVYLMCSKPEPYISLASWDSSAHRWRDGGIIARPGIPAFQSWRELIERLECAEVVPKRYTH